MPDVFVAEKKQKKDAQNQQSQTGNVNNDNLPAETIPSLDLLKHGNSVHLFSSLCQYPNDITFQNQEIGETVLLFIRRAFITNFRLDINRSISYCSTYYFFSCSKIYSLFPFFFIPVNFIVVFVLFYYLVVLTYLYVSFITWYFNISLVTDRRIVDVDFSSVVYKNVAATKLSLVQDVSFSQVGVIRTFFDYGDVLVQTAGTLDNFEFNASPRPENVVHIIGDLIGGSGV